VDAVLHRIEALPGVGRYAVTFKNGDGTEQTAVVQVDSHEIDVAEASLPLGWTRTSAGFVATAAAVAAVDAARRVAPSATSLRDVDGGWDVMLGNVVLTDGAPTCTAHDAMTQSGDVWSCPECGAKAILG
jgi:hypothetical protein